jgi:hypothetical protein
LLPYVARKIPPIISAGHTNCFALIIFYGMGPD